MANSHTFKIDLWKFVDIDSINGELDDSLYNSGVTGMAADINYEVVGAEKNGELTIRAIFDLEA